MKRLLPLLCALPLQAVEVSPELSPYLPPLWQPGIYADYLFQYQNSIQTPLGDFNLGNPINNTSFGLGLTVWPQWNVQLELEMTSDPAANVDFSYLATRVTGRYQLWDEAQGDLFTTALGLSLFQVDSDFLKTTSVWYHGNFNTELSAAIGKECLCGDDWWLRLWTYGGFGVANRGNPWWHATSALQLRTVFKWEISPMIDLVYGTGSNDLNPAEPTPGYAGINHQLVDLGLSVRRKTLCFGRFHMNAWYNVHAHNFPQNYYGVGVTWLYSIRIPMLYSPRR